MKLNKKQKKQVEQQIQAYEKQKTTKVVKVPLGNSELELEVDPFVADPDIMNSGVQVVKYLVETPDLIKGKIVTDMGTGCGIIGIAAAKLGAKKVYMLDIDIKAIKNAKRNIRKYSLGYVCEAFQSNLFSKYGSRTKSDVQIFNHPFFAGDPIKGKDWTKMMLGGTKLIGEYLKQVPKYSSQDVLCLFPWLTFAGNNNPIDNDPLKRSSKYGFKVIKSIEQRPVNQGLQQSLFKIYELKKKK